MARNEYIGNDIHDGFNSDGKGNNGKPQRAHHKSTRDKISSFTAWFTVYLNMRNDYETQGYQAENLFLCKGTNKAEYEHS